MRVVDSHNEIGSEIGESNRYLVLLVNLVSPTSTDFQKCDSNQIRKFYSIFITSLGEIIIQNEGKIMKFQGDTIVSYFPKTNNKNDFNAIKQALECSLKQIENRTSLSRKMNHEGFPEISYRISVDYDIVRSFSEINENWNIIPTDSLSEQIIERTSPNAIGIGADLFDSIRDLREINEVYRFEQFGIIPASSHGQTHYSIYTLGRKPIIN
jgi:two-component system, OmpR family, response regulator ChvI